MTTLPLYFALWNGHRRISWTFHIQILYNKFTLHTLQKLFTQNTLFTDVNLFTGVIETLLTKFAIPQFYSITRFTHHCPTCRRSSHSLKRNAVSSVTLQIFKLVRGIDAFPLWAFVSFWWSFAFTNFHFHVGLAWALRSLSICLDVSLLL